MKIIEVIRVVEEHAPLPVQESFDNSGLMVGDPGQELTGVLITLDITNEVLQEAEDTSCNLIIAHHPLIFKPLKRISSSTLTERLVIRAIQKNLVLYACHTNLDNMQRGVSTALAEQLGLQQVRVLEPKKGMLRKLVTFCPLDHAETVRQSLFAAGAGRIGNYDSCSYNLQGQGTFRALEGTRPYVGELQQLHMEQEVRIETIFPAFLQSRIVQALLESHPYEEVAYDIYPIENEYPMAGMGAIGILEEDLPELSFLEKVKQITGAQVIRHSPFLGKKIKRVALCGGAGAFLIKEAMRQKADVFITGDLKYHDFFEAENRILLADIGHYESEQYAKSLLYSVISEKFTNFAVLISEVCTNPISSL